MLIQTFLKRSLALLCLGTASAAWAAVPYDHIVIVVLENRSANAGGSQRVYDNPALPFFNQLANDPRHGVRFANAWASETPYRRVPVGFAAPLSARPSQPNYLYLFSGSHQGVLPPWFADPTSPYLNNVVLDAQGNRLPEPRSGIAAGIGNKQVPAERRPFATANLGAALRAAGKSFAMFSESLPHPLWDESGDPDPAQDLYRRKHNPAINWVDFGPARTPAKVPADRRRFVLPADVNLAFHSLLILTFDEDGSTDVSQGDPYMFGRHPIATVFYGAALTPGTYTERIDALNVLATVLHDQGLLETFQRDFLATCPDDRATCEREHANLRPIADVFGRGPALVEMPPARDTAR